uniref:Uncharacterized protein n=1 Tax=Arundo donax TaxID=35708 RepID=A0A0A9BH67_ARUDO
MLCYIKFF